MANIYKSKSGYMAQFKQYSLKAGKPVWVKRSTYTHDKEKAQAVADEMQAAANKVMHTTMTRDKALAMVQRILVASGVVDIDLSSRSWGDAYDHYLEHRELSLHTRRDYDCTAKAFIQWLGQDNSLDSIDTHRLYAYVADLKKDLGIATVRKRFRCIKQVLQYAKDIGWVIRNPASAVKLSRDEEARPREAFTPSEVSRLLQLSEGEMHTLMMLGAYTGQRIGDCVSLRSRDFSWGTGVIAFKSHKTKYPIEIPCIEPLLSHLRSLETEEVGGYYMPRLMRAYESGNIGGVLRNFFDQVGIRGETRQGGRLWHSKSFHSFRVGMASRLHAAGVSKDIAMAIVGHKAEQVHSGYIRITVEQKMEALKKVS